MSNLLCIYHANCDDGFGAAWAVRHAFLDKLNPLSSMDGIEFFPAVHGGKVPDVKGRLVLFVDFCYPRAIMDQLIVDCETMVVLDHHKSSMLEWQDHFDTSFPTFKEEALETTCSKTADGFDYARFKTNKTSFWFDMGRSGAMMAWDHYHPIEMAPQFIQYIQDRDLWRNKKHGIREFTAALRSYPMDFETWDRIFGFYPLPELEAGIPIESIHVAVRSAQSMIVLGLVGEGTPIARYKNQLVDSAVKNSFWVEIQVPGQGLVVDNEGSRPAPPQVLRIRGANVLPSICSEVGEELAMLYGGMGMTWVEGVTKWNYQLRSRKVGDQPAPDVSKIASALGGGGHHQAAGFKTNHAIHFKPTKEGEYE